MERYGKYVLLQRLGRGGMAEVFLAKIAGPMGVSRYVALKRVLPDLSNELSEMFLDEVRLAVQLTHPNVVMVYDFGLEKDCYYLAMEYIEGPDLRQVLKRAIQLQKPVTVEVALYVAAQLARGLDHAHKLTDAQGRHLEIVHRDVSPSNVLLSYSGDVKIADFGIARAASRMLSNQTAAGAVKGKIRYMSPEQARGERIDHRSDLFSVGTVLLETLLLQEVFRGDSEMESWKQVQVGVPLERNKHSDKIPPDVHVLLDKIMAPDREQRFADGAEMADAIELTLRKRDPGFGPTKVKQYMDSLFAEDRAARREQIKQFDLVSGTRDEDPKPAAAAIGESDSTKSVPTQSLKSGSTPTRRATDEGGTPKPEVTQTGDHSGLNAQTANVTGESVKRDSAKTDTAPMKSKPPIAWIAGGAAALIAIALVVVFRPGPANKVDDPGTQTGGTASGKTGTLLVESTPKGATISIDGKTVADKTPATVPSVEAGKPHKVKLSLAGHKDDEFEATAQSGSVERIQRTLVAIPRIVTITSNPAPATLSVDGKDVGETPYQLSVENGKTYSLRVMAKGRPVWEEQLIVNERTPTLVTATLEELAGAPQQQYGTLNIQSDPWASVAIDGKSIGKDTPVRGLRLAVGVHKITLSNPGFPPSTVPVKINAGQVVTKSVKLGE